MGVDMPDSDIPISVESLRDIYRESHKDEPPTHTEIEGVGQAFRDTLEGSESRRVMARLALSCALFNDSQDWPQEMRVVAIKTYGLEFPDYA